MVSWMMDMMKLYHFARLHRPDLILDMQINDFAPPPAKMSLSRVTAGCRDSAALGPLPKKSWLPQG